MSLITKFPEVKALFTEGSAPANIVVIIQSSGCKCRALGFPAPQGEIDAYIADRG
jgi:hypothetical protein